MKQVDNTVAALLLIKIAYEQGKVNDATMQNVRDKYKKIINAKGLKI